MQMKTDLFEYQKKAFEKLRHIKVGALYMEMGTGKTRTALELIKLRMDAGKIDHVLWLCPCSVKTNLLVDIKFHCAEPYDWLTVAGIESLSSSDRLYLKLLDLMSNKNVFLIIDESNLVKNFFAIRTKRIANMAKACRYKLILNGTPVSKNEADLFAQWYILDPRILGYQSFWSFSANHLEYDDYGKVRRVLNIDYLTKKIAPYSYIIKKSECLKLPEKEYETRYFYLTPMQSKEYDETKEWLLSNVDEFDSTTVYKLFTGLQQVVSGNKIVGIKPLKSVPMFNSPYDNPRIQKLLSVLDNMDGKVIIWCKFKHEIENIKKVLFDKYGDQSISLFYGDLNLKKRVAEIEKFRDKARFLIANKTCGGYGLNLQFCSNMIYYSNDFNWATRAQSEDRVHRIGQVNDVNIVDICANNKIDGRILDNLYNKGNLCNSFRTELALNRNNLSKWLDGKDDLYDKNRLEPAGETTCN